MSSWYCVFKEPTLLHGPSFSIFASYINKTTAFLDSARYPLLLGQQRKLKILKFAWHFTHDQKWESNIGIAWDFTVQKNTMLYFIPSMAAH